MRIIKTQQGCLLFKKRTFYFMSASHRFRVMGVGGLDILLGVHLKGSEKFYKAPIFITRKPTLEVTEPTWGSVIQSINNQ